MKTQRTARIVRAALDLVTPQFRLPLHHGEHGIDHWVRVWANAERLCAHYGTDSAVPCWFAFLHDSQRENEDRDPLHGNRAAEFALAHWRVHPELGRLRPLSMDQLAEALNGHSDGYSDARSMEVAICWDADRLDLPRCGIRVDPARLCTAEARRMIPESTARANFAQRARRRFVP